MAVPQVVLDNAEAEDLTTYLSSYRYCHPYGHKKIEKRVSPTDLMTGFCYIPLQDHGAICVTERIRMIQEITALSQMWLCSLRPVMCHATRVMVNGIIPKWQTHVSNIHKARLTRMKDSVGHTLLKLYDTHASETLDECEQLTA